VTGATGFIGQHLVKELLHKGYEVVCLVRDKSKCPEFFKHVKLLSGNIEDFSEEYLDGVEQVIHLASLTSTKENPDDTFADYKRINIDGTANILQACEQNDVKRIIYISSIAVLFPEYEDSYISSKRLTEKVVENSKLDWVIIRPSHIFGQDKYWDNIRNQLSKKRWLFIIGQGRNLIQHVYVNDVVNAIILTINNPSITRKKYTIAGEMAFTYKLFMMKIREAIGANYRIINIPNWLLPIIKKSIHMMSTNLATKTSNFIVSQQNFDCDISEAVTDLGYKPTKLEQWLSELQ